MGRILNSSLKKINCTRSRWQFLKSCPQSIPKPCLRIPLKIIDRLWQSNITRTPPIPKSDSTKLCPVGPSSCTRKGVETMLNVRLKNWTEQNGFISNNCFGYSNKRSAKDCLSSLVTEIYQIFINTNTT